MQHGKQGMTSKGLRLITDAYIDVAKMTRFVSHTGLKKKKKNGENCGKKNFLLSPQLFEKVCGVTGDHSIIPNNCVRENSF